MGNPAVLLDIPRSELTSSVLAGPSGLVPTRAGQGGGQPSPTFFDQSAYENGLICGLAGTFCVPSAPGYVRLSWLSGYVRGFDRRSELWDEYLGLSASLWGVFEYDLTIPEQWEGWNRSRDRREVLRAFFQVDHRRGFLPWRDHRQRDLFEAPRRQQSHFEGEGSDDRPF